MNLSEEIIHWKVVFLKDSLEEADLEAQKSDLWLPGARGRVDINYKGAQGKFFGW